MLDRVYFEEDLDQTISIVRQNRYVQLLSETTGGRLECSLRYRELLRHQGFGVSGSSSASSAPNSPSREAGR